MSSFGSPNKVSLSQRNSVSTTWRRRQQQHYSENKNHAPFLCVTIWAFATIFWECASKYLTWSHLCECMVCAAPKRLLLHKAHCQPQHIVTGEIFHWSREERRFQRERFSRAWFTPVSHRTRSRGSAEAARMQSGSSVRPLCFHSPRPHEREDARSWRSAT